MTAREIMEYDVVIVGAGPAGLSCAIRLKQQKPGLMIAVIEKASEIGAARLLSRVDGDYSKNFNDALKAAGNKSSKFPVVYVKWLSQEDRFDGSEFLGIDMLNGMFIYNDFREVRTRAHLRSTTSCASAPPTR